MERDFSDYVPVEIVSPYNGEVITVYNLKSAAELSLIDTLVTNGKNKEVYNGFEFAVEARLPGGGTVLGSTTTQRTITNTCDQRDNPNNVRFCDRSNLPAPYQGVDFKNDFKVAVSYPLPFGVQVSANFTSEPGRPEGNIVAVDELLPILWNISRTTRYTAANCAGRPCTAGALVIPGLVETSLVVPLAPAGTARHMERQNQLNFGVKKIIRTERVEWSAEDAAAGCADEVVRNCAHFCADIGHAFKSPSPLSTASLLQSHLNPAGYETAEKWPRTC